MNELQRQPRGPIPVNVDIQEEIPSDADSIKSLQRMGFAECDEYTFKDLSAIGAYIHGKGVIKLMRGRVMVSQQWLDSAMRLLHKELQEVSKREKGRVADTVRLTAALGYVSARQVDAIKLMLALEGGAKALDVSALVDGLVPSFAPGSDVHPSPNMVFAREIHMHPSEAPNTTK